MKLISIVAEPQLNMMCALASCTPPGAFAEVGVYQGGSAQKLYDVARRQNRELHLFDTFVGTPYYTEGLDRHKIDSEFAAHFAPQEIAELMPEAKVYIGVYPETQPTSLGPLAFIHCDCDQYLSYRAVIEHMWPLLVPDGVLYFDDYPYLAGAKRAVDESFRYESLQLCGQRYYVRKKDDSGLPEPGGLPGG